MELEDGSKLPDFIIIGAMKSGTTSIHHILAHHDNVFMPEKELYFFDVDDVEQHRDFFIKTKRGWTDHDFEKDFDVYFDWYKRFFVQASSRQMIGEETTTYLASKKAPYRIANLLPDVNLVVILRDPVSRAYSHYWHNVAAGRVTRSFEKMIQSGESNLLIRGFYEEHLRRYESFIRKGRLKVVFFEDFIHDQQGVIDELCGYLGLERSVDVAELDAHRNSATVPLIISLRLFGNWIYNAFALNISRRNIPNMPTYVPSVTGATDKKPLSAKLWSLYRNKLPSRKYPPMNPEIREHLERVFSRANAGLADLIDRDVRKRWQYMQ